ncbi:MULTISPECIES: hypothetical protein [unclassified Streptomyces]|uniref:hypothetical protein n=1 Tax=unclassified Streptomyces TaxID=2593676 RepID=UPI00365847F1
MAQYRGPVHQQDRPGGTREHVTTTAERGAFAFARCSCGWSGPARRSRERARTDAVSHEATD